MTFSDEYNKHLEVLQTVGLTRIDPIEYKGTSIVPLQFLKALLPEPSSLAENYTGKTSIGAIIQGVKDGVNKEVVIYNVCDHAGANREIGAHAVSYTTGVPAVTGAMMVLQGLWSGQGVFNVEQFPPEPFLAEVAKQGLPWHVEERSMRDVLDPPHQ
jgi:saccharopine dehydrogenase (NAD+, L-lysine-forming)